MIIYDKNNIERCEIKSLEYNGEFMGERFVSATIKSPFPIDFELGDYIDYRGERFTLNYDPSIIKKAEIHKSGEAFTYENVKFNSYADELLRCEFLDYVLNDNLIHFSSLPTFGFHALTIQDLADRIKANLDRVYPGLWTINVASDVEVKNVFISADKLTVWGALALVSTTFKSNFIIRGRTITIGTAGNVIDNVFEYGKGKGLNKITKVADSEQQIITRLRVYGSTRNLPLRYYNKLTSPLPSNMAVQNLMLPSFPYTTLDPYLDSPNIGELGVMEGSVFFDGSNDLPEIYPSLEGMTASELISAGIPVDLDSGDNGNLDEIVSITNEDGTPITDDGLFEEGETVPPFKLTIKDIGFDINDYLSGETATISLKTGMNGGREFEILSCEKVGNKYVLTCNRVEDIGRFFPYSSMNINAGDKFVLLNIEMPEVYIQAASQRLLEAGQAYLSKNDYVRYTYDVKLSPIYMAKNPLLSETIIEGDYLMFSDIDLDINGSIIIDSLRIIEGKDIVPTYEVTLTEEKQVGTLQKIKNQLSSLLSGTSGALTAEIESLIQLIGNRQFLSKVKPDTARALIKFLDGSEFGEFASGMFTGKGGRIDSDGNGELESLVIRSLLEVPELRYNRLTLVGEDLAIGAGGLITEVWQDEDEDGNVIYPNSYNIRLKLEEGDIIPFHLYDIVKGIYHQNTGFYTSWFRVDAVYHNLQYMTISLGADEAVPAGRNYPPRPFMNIAKWGNFVDTTRQSTIFLSAKDGHIIMLDGVDNYKGGYKSFQLGKPEGLENVIDFSKLTQINKEQGYLYARGIMVSDIIEIDYQGAPIRKVRDRGIWSFETAISEEPYEYTETLQDEVWVGWSRYRCIVDKPTGEPSRQSSEWVLVYSIEDAIKEETKSLTQGLEDVSIQLGSAQTNIGELDSAMHELKTQTLVALEDDLISEAERRSLYSIYVRLDVEQEQLLSDVTYALNSIYMPDIYKAKLQSISNKFLASGGSLDQYQASIEAILDHADPHVTEYERAEYERTLKIYSRDYKSLSEALRDSRLAIDAEIKRMSNQKTDEVEGGKNLLRNYDLRWDFDYWGGSGDYVEVDFDEITIFRVKGLSDDGRMVVDKNGNRIQVV